MQVKRPSSWAVIFGAVLFVALCITAALPTPAQAKKEPTWQRQAEENFYMPPGMAGKLMTKHEWEQHWKAMENMGPRQQSRYRREWHVKMMQRAQQRGVQMPGMGNHHGGGQGMGQGMGQGSGQGMGMGQGGGGQAGSGSPGGMGKGNQ